MNYGLVQEQNPNTMIAMITFVDDDEAEDSWQIKKDMKIGWADKTWRARIIKETWASDHTFT